MFFNTIARTHRPLRRVDIAQIERYLLGFNVDGKIELFVIGNTKPKAQNKQSTEIEGLDFSALSVKPGNILDQKFNLTDAQILQQEKWDQLSLLYTLCKKNGLEPGKDPETDRNILELLRSTLSDNIINPDEVVKEFIMLWNELAPHQGPSNNQEQDRFLPHPALLSTVEVFYRELANTLFSSQELINFLKIKMSTLTSDLDPHLNRLKKEYVNGMLQAFQVPKLIELQLLQAEAERMFFSENPLTYSEATQLTKTFKDEDPEAQSLLTSFRRNQEGQDQAKERYRTRTQRERSSSPDRARSQNHARSRSRSRSRH